MPKIKIPNAEVQSLLSGKNYIYPKYATQILNLANSNAQGTRPKTVGQMSDLIQEFQGTLLEEWEKWYQNGRPTAIDDATEKVFKMVEQFKDAIVKIDKATVRNWVEELVIVKTFAGLKFQSAILIKLSAHFDKPFRLATAEEEAKGIDGFIGGSPVSIKPLTYKSKMALNENIEVPLVFYDKRKAEIIVEFDENFKP